MNTTTALNEKIEEWALANGILPARIMLQTYTDIVIRSEPHPQTTRTVQGLTPQKWLEFFGLWSLDVTKGPDPIILRFAIGIDAETYISIAIDGALMTTQVIVEKKEE